MKEFVIVATITRRSDAISFELTARIEVQAASLSDAYKKVRKVPEFRHAHLRPE